MNESNLAKLEEWIDEVSKVLLGKREVIKLTLTAILSGGHVLFEDVPGVGKTLLVKTISKTIQCDYNRIQFTPDLLPNDIIGVSIYDIKDQSFKFHKGPIFTSILLVDEINRATPKTQSALLEAMAEKEITIDNATYELSPHFTVLATQNPVEHEGTYSLPEAQLDRFLLKLKIGYPSFEDELQLILGEERTLIEVKPVMTVTELTELKKQVKAVFVHEKVARYALRLVQETREHEGILLGVSPRGSEDFMKAAKAYALIEGRQYVTPKDLQQILPYCFSHRIKLKNNHQPDERLMTTMMEEIIENVPIPIER